MDFAKLLLWCCCCLYISAQMVFPIACLANQVILTAIRLFLLVNYFKYVSRNFIYCTFYIADICPVAQDYNTYFWVPNRCYCRFTKDCL